MKTKPLEKAKAKRLYVNNFQTAAHIAKTVCVTEKTVGKWIRDGDWKTAREKEANKQLASGKKLFGSPLLLIEDLRAYIEENSPLLAKKFNPIIDSYLKTIEQ